MFPKALRGDWRWLSSGFLLMFFSGFGQTYYIAIFAGQIKSELLLSDGQFGTVYTLGTLASASLLTWAGKYADLLSVRALGAGVIAGLALTALIMAAASSVAVLALAVFGLRFFGQGMLTHVAMTAMGRWFNRKRGRAISIAALGLPASEGVLPLLAVVAMAAFGWRGAWIGAAVILLLALPVLLSLLHYERHPTHGPVQEAVDEADATRWHWTRSDVLRDPLFYLLMPITLATPFIITAIFINQVPLVEIKNWKLEWFAASFPLLAIAHVIGTLTCGRLVDRFGARHVLPAYLLSLGIGTLLLVYGQHPAVLPVLMVLLGVTMGFAATTQGALWPELYGTRHLGAIRSVSTALVVFSTAVSPGLVGVLMDAGVALESQLLVMGVYSFAAAAWSLVLRPRLDAVAAS